MKQTYGSAVGAVFAALFVFGIGTAMAAPESFFKGVASRDQAHQRVKELKVIQARNQAGVMSADGVHGLGIGLNRDTGELGFVVFVDPSQPNPSVPASIEGVPVQVRRVGRFQKVNGGLGCLPCHSDQTAYPVEMGNSTSSPFACYSCSMGFKACQSASSELGYFTNAHCSTDDSFCENTAPLGSDTMHRSLGDNGCDDAGLLDIGDVDGYGSGGISCPVDNLTDSTFVRSTSAETTAAVRDLGTPGPTPWLSLPGDDLMHSGRTTGTTAGTVIAIGAAVDVGGYCCGVPTFIDQIVLESTFGDPISLGGDSGSGWYRVDPAVSVAGLNFAGTEDGLIAIANHVSNVLALHEASLDLSLCAAPPEVPATTETGNVLFITLMMLAVGFLAYVVNRRQTA